MSSVEELYYLYVAVQRITPECSALRQKLVPVEGEEPRPDLAEFLARFHRPVVRVLDLWGCSTGIPNQAPSYTASWRPSSVPGASQRTVEKGP